MKALKTIYNVLVAPNWETFAYPWLGTVGILNISLLLDLPLGWITAGVYWSVFGLPVSHFIVSWVVRAKKHGLGKALTPTFLWTFFKEEAPDFIIRTFVSSLFVLPYLFFGPLHATVISAMGAGRKAATGMLKYLGVSEKSV